MAKVKLEIETDTTEIQSAFNKQEKSLNELQKESKELGAAQKTAFVQSADAVKKYDTEVRKTTKDVKSLRGEAEAIKVGGANAVKRLATESSKARTLLDTTGRIATTVGQKISAAFRKGADSAKNFSERIKTWVNKPMQDTGNQAQGLGAKLSGMLAAIGLAQLGRQMIGVRSEFEKFEAVLVNTLGSKSDAQIALGQIKEFAAVTPFSVSELTSSFVKLANQGFKPTLDEMTRLGDLAASTGKTFDMLTEAIIDAQTGEFERLKEFGIRASKEGDKVTFTFKGVKTQTDFTNESIRKYILSLGELQGVSGAMAAISETMGGKISNLGDAWDSFLNSLGKLTSPLIISSLEGLSNILTGIANTMDRLSDPKLINQDMIFDAITMGGKVGGQSFTEEMIPKVTEYSRVLAEAGVSISDFSEENIKAVEKYAKTAIQFENLTSNLAKNTAEQNQAIAQAIRIEAGATKSAYEQGAISLEEYGVQIRVIEQYAKKTAKALNEMEDAGGGGLTEAKRKEMEAEMNKWLKEYEESIERYKKAVQDYKDAQLDLTEKVLQAQIGGAEGQKQLDLQRDYNMRELDLLEQKFIEIGKKTDANFKLTSKQEEQFQILRIAVLKQYGKDSADLIQKQYEENINKQALITNRAAQFLTQSAGSNLTNLDTREQTEINAVSLLAPTPGMSQEDYEEMKQRAILNIQRKYMMERLALIKVQREAELNEREIGLRNELLLLEGKNDEESKQKREQINKTIKAIREQFGLESVEIETGIAKQINEIQDSIDKIGKEKKPDVKEFLGLSAEDQRSVEAGLQLVADAADTLYGIQINKLDQELRQSDERERRAEDEIAKLESMIVKEKELKEQGKANNLSLYESQLQAQKDIAEQEKELQKKTLEDKKELQRQQIALDALLQVNNLVTASTQIYKGLTAIDPTGISGGIAVAALLTAFAASKKKAFDVVNEQQFAKGVINLNGPGTETSDSIPAKLSKGESVMTAKETRRHLELFEAIRSGSQPKYASALIKELSSLSHILPSASSFASKKDYMKNEELKILMNNDYSSLSVRIDETNKTLSALLQESKNRVYTDARGNTVKQAGNHSTIIRKNG